jgi:hypothetical protein
VSIALTAGAHLSPGPSGSICLASFYKIYCKSVEGRIFTLSSRLHRARLLLLTPSELMPPCSPTFTIVLHFRPNHG